MHYSRKQEISKMHREVTVQSLSLRDHNGTAARIAEEVNVVSGAKVSEYTVHRNNVPVYVLLPLRP